MTENKTYSIEEVLEREGRMLEMTVGYSMWPMLSTRKNPIVIEKKTRAVKVNDVVLYKRPSGKYVLHRVVKIKNGKLIIRGDNCYSNEYDITEEHIFGLLCGFYRGERYIDCNNHSGYKMYVAFWKAIYPIRLCWQKIKALIKKIMRKMKLN